MVKLLIEAGADLDAKTSRGETSLTLAAKKDYLAVTKYLIQQGCDPNR